MFKVGLILVVLFYLAACDHGHRENQSLGPVNSCILYQCPVVEFRQRVRSIADANETTAMGRTALMYAAGIGLTISDRVWKRSGRPERTANRAEYLRVLIDAGANVEAVDDQGETALAAAIYNGDPELVRLLIEAGANPNARENRLSPLHLAALHCDKVIAGILIDAGAVLDAKDSMTGQTATEVAASSGCQIELP